MSSMYGISGAVGLHPCIWCKISSEMMQFLLFIRMLNMPVKRTDASLRFRYEEFVKSLLLNMPVKRTYASLRLRYEEFVAKFRGNLKNAEKISNVIDPVFFIIELT